MTRNVTETGGDVQLPDLGGEQASVQCEACHEVEVGGPLGDEGCALCLGEGGRPGTCH